MYFKVETRALWCSDLITGWGGGNQNGIMIITYSFVQRATNFHLIKDSAYYAKNVGGNIIIYVKEIKDIWKVVNHITVSKLVAKIKLQNSVRSSVSMKNCWMMEKTSKKTLVNRH